MKYWWKTLPKRQKQYTFTRIITHEQYLFWCNSQYVIHLDMKLDSTKIRTFQEMSLSELETLHHLYEIERTQTLQSLALAVLKNLIQDN